MSLVQAYQNAAETLKAAVPVLEETGVTIAMEPLAPGKPISCWTLKVACGWRNWSTRPA